MSKRKKNDDYAALKDLLTSWNLEELFQHMKDEAINIEELEMMKLHHLNELLSNFKLGIRIRFEYNFEKWRHSIFKPLTKNFKINYSSDSIRTTETLQKTSPKDSADVTVIQPQPQPPSNLDPIIPALHLPVKQSSDDADSTIFWQNLKRKSSETVELIINDSQITVLKILNSFGHQGLSLIDSYELNKCFTNPQRQMLVQLIVNYFEINNYHLSLNTSYILEKQIVKYFPNEKIEYYRTEKRGKIYAKFNNMKRKRAETMATAKKHLKPLEMQESSLTERDISNINNNDNNEPEIDLYDDSNEPDFSDLPVKIEYISD